ncbi:MAG TPA: alpha/beta hydrolase-fold protein [Gemmatimonadales bacterium]|nr:alpha/beta hydrolase-fold protein [Gemmatimonadales bacterium]
MTAALRALAAAALAAAAPGGIAAAQAPAAPAQGSAARSDSFPLVTLPGTELRHLKSAATGRDYDLYVSLPADYAAHPDARYPVLYVLDGQWDFKLMLSVQGGLLYDRFTPPVIIVGITYSGANPDFNALRAMDLTPVPSSTLAGSGAAPRFLSFLRHQVIPFVESAYRADPARRVLMGASFGGLFTLYALFTDPSLFAGYVAASPAVSYGDRVGFAVEAAYAAAHEDLPVRLFIGVGEIEDLAGPVQEFWTVLRGRHYAGLTLETRVIAGERHSGNKPEAFNRALRFMLGR